MANPESEDPGISTILSVESANERTSLERTSAESESAISFVTQIDVTSSRPTSPDNKSTKVHSEDAKNSSRGDREVVNDQRTRTTGSLTTRTSHSSSSVEVVSQIQQQSHEEVEGRLLQSSSVDHFVQDVEQEQRSDVYDEEIKEGEEDSFEEDDTTISSEAVVDDIELILMPEMVQDLPSTDLSPQLVRVTELKRSTADYEADVFHDEGDSDQESDFKKMGSDDENYGGGGRSGKDRHSSSAGEDDEEPSSSRGLAHRLRSRGEHGSLSRGKVNSGVQTDITALESENSASIPYEFRRMSSGKSSSRLLGIPGKRLNWKSELTLLPSKTKIRSSGGFTGYESINDQDQYSPRVAKFTSQDALSSSSQFLKPSTLYRTRNLSRNLNQCVSSESTLVLPMSGMTSDSPRYRDRITSSTSTTNFRAPAAAYSSYQISSSSARRHPSVTASSRSLRCSMPDLSSTSKTDNKGRRQTSRSSMKHQQSACGYKLHKKSSSDDEETSSLIDESERCLRSSIDLLLTDDLPSASADYPYTGFGSGSVYGYYSSRRTRSQPVLLTDERDSGDLRDGSMGSPFLPRKLSEMRCSRWAKVILPNGQVTVVSVKEMDEVRDSLNCVTDTGCMITLPFRKVVFAWRIKR